MADSSEPPTTPGSTTAVLLAAGAGTRLGLGPKAALPFRGRTLVEVLADVLLDGGCREVVAVLGADAATVRAATDLSRHRVIDNPDWADRHGQLVPAGRRRGRPGGPCAHGAGGPARADAPKPSPGCWPPTGRAG